MLSQETDGAIREALCIVLALPMQPQNFTAEERQRLFHGYFHPMMSQMCELRCSKLLRLGDMFCFAP